MRTRFTGIARLCNRFSAALLFGALVASAAPACSSQNDGICTSEGLPGSCEGSIPDSSGCLAGNGCGLTPGCQHVRCDLQATESECKSVKDCIWAGVCALPSDFDPCATVSESDCGSTTGCMWGQLCTGQFKSCKNLDQSDCEAVPHCSWNVEPNL